MASIQKITLSVRDCAFHHQTAQSPGGRAVAGIVTRSGYALPGHNPGASLSSCLSRHFHRDSSRARGASLHST